jgi:hypothetical protein
VSGVKGRSGPPDQPKHELHRYRMSQAKLGKRFTATHKAALATSQQARWTAIHDIMESECIPYSDAKLLYKLL